VKDVRSSGISLSGFLTPNSTVIDVGSAGFNLSGFLTRGSVLLLLVSAALMTLWSFVVPIFESPDEHAHWQYVRYVRVNKGLPYLGKEMVEANQPPLYYVVVAPFANYTDIPPLLSWYGPEGHVIPALPRLYQNSYSDYVRYWPIRAVRLMTILISLIAVFFCYASGVEATGSEATGLLAGGLAAFLPQFTFRGMNVSNDAMVTAAGAIVLYCLVRIIKRGTTSRRALVSAIAIAAAFLSKGSALFLPAPFVLVILIEKTGWSSKLKYLSLLSVCVLLAAPWLIRNQVLYGDLLAHKAMMASVDFLVSQKSITSPYFFHLFPNNIAHSFVGVFGWFSLWSPKWLYHFFWLTGAIGFAGCAIGLVRRRIDLRLVGALVLTGLLNLAVVIYINLSFDQPQGRYLFPSLGAVALLVAIGLENLPRWRASLSRGLVAALALMNLYVLLRVVLPGYWPPPSMAFSDAAKPLEPVASTSAPSDELRFGPRDGQFRLGDPEGATVNGSAPTNGSAAGASGPHFIFKTDAAASRYNYFRCTLRGSGGRGLVTGALYLGFCPEDEPEQHRVPFKWICDDSDHVVIVPLWTLPHWGGRLIEVRLDPVESEAFSLESGVGGRAVIDGKSGPSSPESGVGSGYQDLTVHIGSPVLVGSLTSRRGP
jgi:4-amino-4-deoxy-L-arabinose transferase-like glycosyltransferase